MYTFEIIILVVGLLVAILAFSFSEAGARFSKYCFSKGKGLVDWLATCTKGSQPRRVTVKAITTNSCNYCSQDGPTHAVIMEDGSQVDACKRCLDAHLSSGEWIAEKA